MTGKNNHMGRQPDFDVLQEVQMGKHTKLMHIGGLFENDKGYITGNTLHGKMVLAPTNAREALNEMREQKAQQPAQYQEPTLKP